MPLLSGDIKEDEEEKEEGRENSGQTSESQDFINPYSEEESSQEDTINPYRADDTSEVNGNSDADMEIIDGTTESNESLTGNSTVELNDIQSKLP